MEKKLNFSNTQDKNIYNEVDDTDDKVKKMAEDGFIMTNDYASLFKKYRDLNKKIADQDQRLLDLENEKKDLLKQLQEVKEKLKT